MDRRFTEISRSGDAHEITRELVGEVPVALEYNGVSYAVMMASPTHLEDFARGFALTEGLAAGVSDIGDIAIAETPLGFIARVMITGLSPEKLGERVRRRVAESSCGLCGIENLEALAVEIPAVPAHVPPTKDAVFKALGEIRSFQALNARTGAAHGAAFVAPAGEIILIREDVGRHNAIDKLVGALAAEGRDIAGGFVLSTARCSYEIVEKVVRAGAHSLVTISLPTSMAAERAEKAGLSLICLARDDSFLSLSEE